MTYTHRNIHTGRFCYVEKRRFVQGHLLFWVQIEHDTELQLWHMAAFRQNHQRIGMPEIEKEEPR